MERLEKKQHYSFRLNVRNVGYWLFLVFLTLPHMKSAYLARIPAADLVFNILRSASFLIIVFWYVIRRKSVSLVTVLVAVWRFFLVYSTIIHGGAVYECVILSFSIMSVMLLYDASYNGKDPVFTSAQLFCFELFIYINLIAELCYPEGMYIGVGGAFISGRNWFLGYYNNHTQYFVPALMFAWMYKTETGKNLRTIFLTLAIFLSAGLVWSGGVILALLTVAIVFAFFKRFTKVFHYYTYWGLHPVFIVFIIGFKIQYLFRWLLDDFLGKWGSLISRMNVWERTRELIAENPIFGHGDHDSFSRVAELNVGWAATHAHNMLLEVLYQGGIVGLVMWVLIVVCAGRNVYKYRDSDLGKIISTAFLGWCVATLVEPFTTPFLMGMFVIAYRFKPLPFIEGHMSGNERMVDSNAIS